MSGAAPATYVALSGGIGGAKLALGLTRLLGGRLTVIVNTGDDFAHLGLEISPDVDTTLYTLAGIANPETGWGRREETWSFMEAIGELGGPTWFKLGDRDLATHVERTQRLRAGETPTAVTAHLSRRLGVTARVLPMTDAPVRTVVESDAGTLAFQDYFVREQCRPAVRSLRYEGAAAARVTSEAAAALSAATLGGIILCPSNPWLSIDPILAVPGLREAIRASGAPVVAVTPIVAGKAVKGPTAKIMAELGLPPDVGSIVRHYGDLLDLVVVDAADGAAAGSLPVRTSVTDTLMHTVDDKVALARHCLAVCDELAGATRWSAQRPSATWAVVPVKALEESKQRLAGVLPPEARRRLMLVMLRDVLSTLAQVERLGPVLVVTPDAEVADIVQRCGARVLREEQARGHSAAAMAGFAYALAHGAVEALTLPADAPCVTPGEVSRLLDAACRAAGPSVVLVPSHDRDGTNAVLLAPPDTFPPSFGPGSFARHLALAEARQIDCRIVELAGLGLDIDEPRDLAALIALRRGVPAYAFLEPQCGALREVSSGPGSS